MEFADKLPSSAISIEIRPQAPPGSGSPRYARSYQLLFQNEPKPITPNVKNVSIADPVRDVVGYSRLISLDEEETLSRLKELRHTVIDPRISEHRGRIVKTMGDGLLVQFASAVDAVRCAADIQQLMIEQQAGTAEDRRIDFRIGINVGDIVIDGDDIYGDGVNVAARLEALAEPGGTSIARAPCMCCAGGGDTNGQ
jgi:hypothetical protein